MAPAGPLPGRAPGAWLACIVTSTGPIAAGETEKPPTSFAKCPAPSSALPGAPSGQSRASAETRLRPSWIMTRGRAAPGTGEAADGPEALAGRRGATAIADWQAGFAPFTAHPSLQVSDERLAGVFAEFTDRLGAGNYPYFHPHYAGQMLKPPHPVAVAGYLAAMLINPNNHALDGGRATSEMEKEAVAQLAAMFGLPAHLGHLTTSGTIANLEALYVARELQPRPGHRVQRGSALHAREDVPGCSASRRSRSRWTARAGWTWPRWTRCWPAARSARWWPPRAPRVWARSTRCTRSSRWPAGTAYACTSTQPTAASSRCLRGGPTGQDWSRRRGGRSARATRWSSTRTSTACSPTAAARCCSATRRSAGSTCTTRPTPTSPRTSCTWARSAWSARGPGRRPPRCG